MSKPEQDQRHRPVLSDHKRIGKRFIPPLAQLNMSEVSWVDSILPELIWLGLLNSVYGKVKGAELAISLPKIAARVTGGADSKEWFVSVSSFYSLTKSQWREVVKLLTKTDQIDIYRKALSPLANYYPECPFVFLFDTGKHSTESSDDSLQRFRQLLHQLLSRRSVEATFVQANAVYISFVTGKLKVMENFTLAEFPSIEDYPDTEISKRIASSVRATINVVFGGEIYKPATDWSEYFWNRGLELEPCSLEWETSDES